MQQTIKVPTSWEDITVNQYQLLNTLKREAFKTDLEYTTALVNILCHTNGKDLKVEALNEIAGLIGFLSNELKAERKDTVIVDHSEKYKWIGDFNSITVGEMLSIEQVIDMEELNYNISVDIICSVLLRKGKEKFNAKLFNERRALFGELPITDVIGMVNFFSNGGRHSIQNTKDYLIIPMMRRSTKSKRIKLILWRVTNGFQWLINLQDKILQSMRGYMMRITLTPSIS